MLKFSRRFPGLSTVGALTCMGLMMELTVRTAPVTGLHLAAAGMVLMSSVVFALPTLLLVGSPDELPHP